MKIAVSACLLGVPCRYDGGSKPCAAVRALEGRHELVPVCPEQLGGMSIPHPPCEIDARARSLRVIDETGRDRTGQFVSGAHRALDIALERGVRLAVLKERSPSCGCDRVYDGTFSGRLVPGSGLATRLFRAQGIRVLGESQVAECTEAVFAESALDTPALQTERLVLRPLSRADADDVFSCSSDPDIGLCAGWEPHRTVDDSLRFIEQVASRPHVFGIAERDAGRVVGSIGLVEDPRRSNPDCLMLGYSLDRSRWGRGYATEAAREVVRYGFCDLRLSLVTATCYAFNHRSARVLEKCGLAREGTLRAAERSPDGRLQDLVCYSMTRDEHHVWGRRQASRAGRLADEGKRKESHGI